MNDLPSHNGVFVTVSVVAKLSNTKGGHEVPEMSIPCGLKGPKSTYHNEHLYWAADYCRKEGIDLIHFEQFIRVFTPESTHTQRLEDAFASGTQGQSHSLSVEPVKEKHESSRTEFATFAY